MPLVPVAAALCAAGCVAPPTSVLVDIAASPGLALTTATLTVSAGGDALGPPYALPARDGRLPLPGSVRVLVPDTAADLGVRLCGVDAHGCWVSLDGKVTVRPHEEAHLALAADADGSGGWGARYCLGFEDELPADWSGPSAQNGRAAWEPGRAHCGERALHVSIDAVHASPRTAVYGYVQETALVADDLFVRAWVLLGNAPAPAADPPPIGDLFDLDTTVSGQPIPATELGVMSPTHAGDAPLVASFRPFEADPLGRTFPIGQWSCVEWETGPTGTRSVWLDGAALAVNPSQRRDAAAVAALKVGFVYDSIDVTAPVEVWLDDVAVGTTRIGCN